MKKLLLLGWASFFGYSLQAMVDPAILMLPNNQDPKERFAHYAKQIKDSEIDVDVIKLVQGRSLGTAINEAFKASFNHPDPENIDYMAKWATVWDVCQKKRSRKGTGLQPADDTDRKLFMKLLLNSLATNHVLFLKDDGKGEIPEANISHVMQYLIDLDQPAYDKLMDTVIFESGQAKVTVQTLLNELLTTGNLEVTNQTLKLRDLLPDYSLHFVNTAYTHEEYSKRYTVELLKRTIKDGNFQNLAHTFLKKNKITIEDGGLEANETLKSIIDSATDREGVSRVLALLKLNRLDYKKGGFSALQKVGITIAVVVCLAIIYSKYKADHKDIDSDLNNENLNAADDVTPA